MLLGVLRDRGAPGVHLGVDAGNHRAMGFYEHLGFTRLGPDHDGSGGSLYGLHL
jgi:ribosomal protein S18 acetylase RimI-like enzyme